MTDTTAADLSASHRFAALLTEKFKGESDSTPKTFKVMEGKKFDRVTQERDGDLYSQSVHAFVERETGHVFKADGWKRPAKGVRFTTVEEAAEAATWHGSYLYR